MKRSAMRGSDCRFPDFAEPVIGRRFAPTRWPHPGYALLHPFMSSKGLRQSGLTEDCIGGVTARDSERHWKISLRYRAVPDFVTALPLTHQRAAGCTQQVTQGAVAIKASVYRTMAMLR